MTRSRRRFAGGYFKMRWRQKLGAAPGAKGVVGGIETPHKALTCDDAFGVVPSLPNWPTRWPIPLLDTILIAVTVLGWFVQVLALFERTFARWVCRRMVHVLPGVGTLGAPSAGQAQAHAAVLASHG